MRVQGAVVREQGQTFAVVTVRPSVLSSNAQANQAILSFRSVFPGISVVLMAQDSRGRPTYFGRSDIARFLSRIPMSAIPWRQYTIS